MGKCKFNALGICTRNVGRNGTYSECKPITADYYINDICMIESHDVCELQSSYGNRYHRITEEDLEELKAGKIIYINDGEYCHFITLKKGEK
jgi:hypothetical protein